MYTISFAGSNSENLLDRANTCERHVRVSGSGAGRHARCTVAPASQPRTAAALVRLAEWVRRPAARNPQHACSGPAPPGATRPAARADVRAPARQSGPRSGSSSAHPTLTLTLFRRRNGPRGGRARLGDRARVHAQRRRLGRAGEREREEGAMQPYPNPIPPPTGNARRPGAPA